MKACKCEVEATAGSYLSDCMHKLQVKMHWVHAEYWKAGPDGNDIHKTNVPNLRMRYRYDCHTEEHNLVMQGAQTFEARKAAKHRD